MACYRCQKHETVRQHNSNARANAEKPELDAECGACIMHEVWWQRRHQLIPVLESLARQLRLHAIMRERIATLEQRLLLLGSGTTFIEPNSRQH